MDRAVPAMATEGERAHAAQRADAARAGRMASTRRRALLLLGLAFVLVADGPSSNGHAEPSGSPAAALPLDAERVAAILAVENSNLSPREVSRIGAAVVRYSTKYGLDPELVTAVLLVESSARPWARSPKGAQGLMQVMPYMMRPLGMAGNATTIETNVEAGCLILASNIRRLGEHDGISAYFWGSDIRGQGYLERVQSARERVRRRARS